MYKTSQEQVDALLSEIERAIERKAKSLYKINESVSEETISLIRSELSKDGRLSFELKKCKGCSNIWDIIIYFKEVT